MGKLFSLDGGFLKFMTRVADALILNFLFLITSIPIVTIGASYTAMYYYCTKAVVDEEGYVWKSYWKSFKTNFKQGFLLELIFAVISYILVIDLQFLYQAGIVEGVFGWRIVFFVVIGLAVLVALAFLYVFPLLARFDNTTFALIKNAVFIGVRHFSYTIPLIMIALLCILLGWLLFPMSIFFIVGAWVYVSSFLFQKVIDRYIPKEDAHRYDEDYYLGADMSEAQEAETEAEHIIMTADDDRHIVMGKEDIQVEDNDK